MDRPFGLLAELTYGCPLHCPYCSNPLNIADYSRRADHRRSGSGCWTRPRSWACCSSTCRAASRCSAATSPRSCGAPASWACTRTSSPAGSDFSHRRAEQLRAAGLDHVQISIQADEAALSDRIAGTPSFERKLAAARLVKKLGWPLTLNVVLHRHNIDRIARILGLAEELGADRIELANTQYYGWALRNRDALLPSRAQLERAEAVVRAARERLRGRMEIIYVLPDYYSRYPKPCMGGWGRRQLTVAPNGDVLPCPTAHECLPLPRASVREHALAWIWARVPRLPALPRRRTGCRNPAGAATAASSTSAAAAARRSS